MTVDREQIRRDAEEVVSHGSFVHEDLPAAVAGHCLALLAELEQAERNEEITAQNFRLTHEALNQAEARLAKVPALVEALEMYAERVSDGIRAREALAAWEQDA